MKLFHNIVTYFYVNCVICGEITYTSNIFKIDPLKYFVSMVSPHVLPAIHMEIFDKVQKIPIFFQKTHLLP